MVRGSGANRTGRGFVVAQVGGNSRNPERVCVDFSALCAAGRELSTARASSLTKLVMALGPLYVHKVPYLHDCRSKSPTPLADGALTDSHSTIFTLIGGLFPLSGRLFTLLGRVGIVHFLGVLFTHESTSTLWFLRVL